jgi:hypothetical protein
MGVIINDKIELPIGTAKNQCFFNIGYDNIVIQKNSLLPNSYNVSVSFNLYFDQDSYLKNGICLEKKRVNLTLSSQELNQNLYNVLYEKLKNEYTSFINV